MDKIQFIRCPNNCIDGLVKVYDSARALYDLIRCGQCKSKGKIKQL